MIRPCRSVSIQPSIFANSRSANNSDQRRRLNSVCIFCGGNSSVSVAIFHLKGRSQPRQFFPHLDLSGLASGGSDSHLQAAHMTRYQELRAAGKEMHKIVEIIFPYLSWVASPIRLRREDTNNQNQPN